MHPPFFPNAAFGWCFLIALSAILVTACYFDLRHRTIPNKLTVPALLLGFAINMARFGLLVDYGFLHGEVSHGIVAGFVFSFLGFLFGFGLFVIFWSMGVCGGGDLKLFAAVASWLGWAYSFWFWLASFILVSVTLLVSLALPRSPELPPGTGPTEDAPKKRRGLLPYALPLTIAVIIGTLWAFRKELFRG